MNYRQYQKFIYHLHQPNPGPEYEEISGGKTWRDSPELQAVQAPAFLENEIKTSPHTPPTITIFQGDDY